jgi:hypothetical protein
MMPVREEVWLFGLGMAEKARPALLGDENLRMIARVLVGRILRKYGYPPDKQEKATQTVLEQAEALCADWAG